MKKLHLCASDTVHPVRMSVACEPYWETNVPLISVAFSSFVVPRLHGIFVPGTKTKYKKILDYALVQALQYNYSKVA